jgi:YVTN family beta-propeller protein
MIHNRFFFRLVVGGFGSELNLRRPSLLKSASSLVLLLSIVPMALAQGTGNISGYVRDAYSGGALPDTAVTVMMTEQHTTRTTHTDAQGFYDFVAIPAGHYIITFEAHGFKKEVRSDIELTASQDVRADVQLTDGDFQIEVGVPQQPPQGPLRAMTDPGVVTTRQLTTPAGASSVFQGKVYATAFGKNSSDLWVLTNTEVIQMDWLRNEVKVRLKLPGNPGLQGLRYDPVANAPLITLAKPTKKGVAPQAKLGLEKGIPPQAKLGLALMTVENGVLQTVAEWPGSYLAGSPGIARSTNINGQRLAVVPALHDDKLAIIDLNGHRFLREIPTGIAPFAAVLNNAGTVAFASNWGGRIPVPGDLTAATGRNPDAADKVVVDKRGIAASGTVTRLDLNDFTVAGSIPAGLHSTALALDEARHRLYVANTNSDSLTVVDTTTGHVLRTIRVQPFSTVVTGVAPTAIAVSTDGSLLYVACGGINAVVVLQASTGKILGMIPTAWYPNDLSLSPDGKYLAVSSLLGVGSGWRGTPERRFVHANRGAVAVVPIPNDLTLAGYTIEVAENNHMHLGNPHFFADGPHVSRAVAIPSHPGEPSLIDHIVYIIKENRSYDQVFGDLHMGNGDPSLVMYGPDITPNQHRLAEQFVLLDNFYAAGGNSADGHQWATQANETDYTLWPGYLGRSYPFDGTDPLAYSNGGFIWEAALKAKKSVRVYGEFAPAVYAEFEPKMPNFDNNDLSIRSKLLNEWREGNKDFSNRWKVTSPIPSLQRVLSPDYPPFSCLIPDVVRAQLFLNDLKKWEDKGSMPNLVIMTFPNDHTMGTWPGISTPAAMVADNDYAVGQIADALSHSKFWNKMLILVVEDDAQSGVDHVDGHRTVALAISPYIRRKSVDSTMYSHPSMLKTIELVLGIPPLSLFDLIATDMRASFQDEPDLTPFHAEEPKQSLFEMTPPLTALRGSAKRDALASTAMNFSIPDAAPTGKLNRILWNASKGATVPYPTSRHGAFAPLSVDVDDADR